LFIIACLSLAFIGTFISYNKVISDNIFLGKEYFLHEQELIAVCKIDYNEYMTARRDKFVSSLSTIFSSGDYSNRDVNIVLDFN